MEHGTETWRNVFGSVFGGSAVSSDAASSGGVGGGRDGHDGGGGEEGAKGFDMFKSWFGGVVEKGSQVVQGAAGSIQATAADLANELRGVEVSDVLEGLSGPAAEDELLRNADNVRLPDEEVAAVLGVELVRRSGYEDERLAEELQARIRGIAGDLRRYADFITPAPPETFEFEMMDNLGLCARYLKTDSKLRRLRFLVVPKRLSEPQFWTHFMYKVEGVIGQLRDDVASRRLPENYANAGAKGTCDGDDAGLLDDEALIATLEGKLGFRSPNANYAESENGEGVRVMSVRSSAPDLSSATTGDMTCGDQRGDVATIATENAPIGGSRADEVVGSSPRPVLAADITDSMASQPPVAAVVSTSREPSMEDEGREKSDSEWHDAAPSDKSVSSGVLVDGDSLRTTGAQGKKFGGGQAEVGDRGGKVEMQRGGDEVGREGDKEEPLLDDEELRELESQWLGRAEEGDK